MLKLTLEPEDYLTINGDIVVQLMRVAGGHADIAIHADRTVPILRGEVLERQGGRRPACLEPPQKKSHSRRDRFFRWNDDRERAVRRMQAALDRLEANGAAEEASILRAQLTQIIPAQWEDEVEK